MIHKGQDKMTPPLAIDINTLEKQFLSYDSDLNEIYPQWFNWQWTGTDLDNGGATSRRQTIISTIMTKFNDT